MKYLGRWVFAGIVLLVIAWGGIVYFKNLRGDAPAVLPPPKDSIKSQNSTGLPLTLPSRFSISIFAKDLPGARVIQRDGTGIGMLVSFPEAGNVVHLQDTDKDGVAESVNTVVSGLSYPHGIEVECPLGGGCLLYVGETNQVSAFDYDVRTYTGSHKRQLTPLPAGGNHITRTLYLTAPGKLLISIGSSCNVCVEADDRRAAILKYDANTKKTSVLVSGLRNAVFMKPRGSTQIWVTEMGRDNLGDDTPPDEINILNDTDVGGNYGWPYCYGKNIQDMQFDSSEKAKSICEQAIASHIDIPAHSAPLGLAFIPPSWPAEYRDDLLVAYHGSWDRREPTGYKIVRFKLDESGNYQGVEDFITGWLASDSVLGRPVDLLFDPQGVLYISDDKAGVIYRLTQR